MRPTQYTVVPQRKFHHQMLVDAVEDTLQVGALTLSARGTFRDLLITLHNGDQTVGTWELNGYKHGNDRLLTAQGPIDVEYLRGRVALVFRARSFLGRTLFARAVRVEYDLGLVGNLPVLRINEPAGERRYAFARRDWR